jgi:hypothetical protein
VTLPAGRPHFLSFMHSYTVGHIVDPEDPLMFEPVALALGMHSHKACLYLLQFSPVLLLRPVLLLLLRFRLRP